jgi:hypothetical protein
MIVSQSDGSAPSIVGIADRAKRSPDGTVFYTRPDYTLDQACQVANWLNGKDGPIHGMKARSADEWDPVNRRNWHAARQDSQRRGLAPLPDKE